MGVGELLPGVGLGGLQGQADALAVEVDVEDPHRHVVADLATIWPGWSTCFQESSETWMRPSMPPRSTKAPKLTTEETTPLRTSPGFRLVRNSSRWRALSLFQVSPPGKHHVVAVLVELDDLRLELAPDVGLQVAHPAQLHQGSGQEAAQADVQDQPALDDLDDRAADGPVALLHGLDGPPGPLVLGTLLGEHEPALFVLLLEDERLDPVARP